MNGFEEILDPLSVNRVVDLKALRELCARGIPDQPPWIRPRVWKLLLGTLPPEKDRWADESKKSRERYYDLATQFLDEVEQMPEPTYPLCPQDKLLDTIAKDVARTQPRVPFFRSYIEPSALSPLSPLPHGYLLSKVDDEEEGVTIPQRIESADALFERLEMIDRHLHPVKSKSTSLARGDSLEPPKTPEIRLSPDVASQDPEPSATSLPSLNASRSTSPAPVMPSLSVTSPSATSDTSQVELLASQPLPKPVPKHSQILLRVLYLFSVTHPHQPYTQGLNELLAPLYLALCMDLDERESVHSEADAFWLFSELFAEVGAVVGEPGDWRQPEKDDVVKAPGGAGAASDGVRGAMIEFSGRLKWADFQLWEDLARKSLDPALPYYSYRWIACLLAQDLPIGSVLRVWDTLFAQPPSTPDTNPKISFLLNICTSMLIRLRFRLVKTGNIVKDSGGLWGDEYVDADAVAAARTGIPPPTSPMPASDGETHGVMGEGFIEGMQLLQSYPVQAIGLQMIIDGAIELSGKMERDAEQRARGPSTILLVGSHLRQRILDGLTNKTALGEEEPPSGDESDGELTKKDADKHPATVASVEQEAAQQTPSLPSAGYAAKWRQYAEALKESDAAASLSKASTNWRLVAMDALRSKPSAETQSPPASPTAPSSPNYPGGILLSPNETTDNRASASSRLRHYADALRSSDTAASLSKVSTNWTAAAIDRWNKPILSSPLNPNTPPPPPPPATPISPQPDGQRSRGGSLGSWTAWGSRAGSLLGVTSAGAPSDNQGLSPTWSPQRDGRNSLPVPLRGPGTPGSTSPQRSPSRSSTSSSPRYSPPPKPVHFANPRDSFIGYVDSGDFPDPLQEALAKARAEPSQVSPEDTTASRLGKSIQSALATLSGTSPRPPPPPLPKVAPRPLWLGTAVAKNPPNVNTVDSRPSSISSNASLVSASSSAGRSVTPTNRTSQATSVRTDSPSQGRPDVDAHKLPEGNFVPLSQGVGRRVGSTTLMRKSRAAHTRQPASQDQRDSSPPVVSPDTPERQDSGTEVAVGVPSGNQEIAPSAKPKKYALTDGPVIPKPSDGYSSTSSAGVPVLKERASRIRTKRYQPRSNPLRVVTVQPKDPDEFGSIGALEAGTDEFGLRPSTQLLDPSPITPQGFVETLKTPTSADKDATPKSPRSPRRVRKVASRERDIDNNTHPLSEEEGTRADDEDGYGDLLSAYSEDDSGGQKGYAI
ncbi:hypothetical protein FRB99_008614 [Tulasnella sp. 403]|nr:hypothetical protein FRB99_008614 [Tulasnella sp. 403]